MAQKDIAVSVKNIHKDFILPQSKNTSLKQVAVNIVRQNNKVTQKVLNDVSFDIHKGDFFGIVGRNGSGKSTLLKLIAGVYTPTAGSVEVNGGLTPFIELGVGFNPELSGRDNVYLNGALLGFTRKQMDEMYDEIVDFAELGPFMDQKLKNYSSGMQVRLAFSIAIKAKNDILIFDEVLAVGDEAFQRKCLDIFEQYRAEGQTVVLVTHDMATVKKFCNNAALINNGKLVDIGDALKIASLYSQLNDMEIDKENAKRASKIDSVFSIKMLNQSGKETNRFKYGEMLKIQLSWKDLGKLESIGVNIFKKSGEHVTGHNSRFVKGIDINDRTKIELNYRLNIVPGKYFVYPEAFYSEGKAHPTDFDGPAFTVEGLGTEQWSGLVDLPHEWYVS